jgi:hypothetical protein
MSKIPKLWVIISLLSSALVTAIPIVTFDLTVWGEAHPLPKDLFQRGRPK